MNESTQLKVERKEADQLVLKEFIASLSNSDGSVSEDLLLEKLTKIVSSAQRDGYSMACTGGRLVEIRVDDTLRYME